jgi:hypothetical protein
MSTKTVTETAATAELGIWSESVQYRFASSDFFGATLEQAKDGPFLVSATGATTWIEFAAGS